MVNQFAEILHGEETVGKKGNEIYFYFACLNRYF